MRYDGNDQGNLGAGPPHPAHPKYEVELTPAEREAFHRLARERPPSEFLEARVVTALRSEGVLRSGRSAGKMSRGSTKAVVPAWAAAAAGFVLLVTGTLTGHRLGANAATQAFLEVREQDVALRVQQVGSAYVRSLLTLEALSQASGAGPRGGHGPEVAATTFHAAARVIARLDPMDPFAPALIDILEDRLSRQVLGPTASRRAFSF